MNVWSGNTHSLEGDKTSPLEAVAAETTNDKSKYLRDHVQTKRKPESLVSIARALSLYEHLIRQY